MRVPLSWLTDFAPFEGDPAVLAATLDDLGLVVEGMERVGEGLEGLVVARVEEVGAIAGADRIRRVVVDRGGASTEVICGASNFELGDLVVLAPVGSVLPGGVEIRRVTMKGTASNGMLCSGKELALSDDHAGILRLNDVDGAAPGALLTDVLGIEPDVVFDLAIEANRPDAWSMAGVARDLAAKLGLPFAIPDLPVPAVGAPADLVGGPPVETLASLRVEDTELCPRFTVRVLTGVAVGSSPRWLARRLTLAGMRPINSVVDASNYVMLELGQPTHPYDLDRLPGAGLVVRRAAAGEELVTLDGEVRTLGRPGPGLGDTGQDCLICDAENSPVGIAGIMGGASSEIAPGTTRVLLETAYFDPMAIARTSKRLALRTEASARFERGCDPEGIDRAAERVCRLLALSGGTATLATGVLDERHGVPGPIEITVRPARVSALLGSPFSARQIAETLAPIGFVATPDVEGGDALRVTVPTFRPDIRPGPMGEADVTEEVARLDGYARLERRTPAWPQPGRLTRYQRERRRLRDVLCGLGASEAWTTTFLTEAEQVAAGFDPPYVEVTNPLVEAERYLRSSMAPGLLGAVRHNVERRQEEVRFFEVGSVFRRLPEVDPAEGPAAVESTERLSAIFALAEDDAWTAVAAWRTVADTLRLADHALWGTTHAGPESRVLHDHRSASVVSLVADADGGPERPTHLGVVGELDPTLVERFELVDQHGRPRRMGWLDLDLRVLLDHDRVPRRPEASEPVSRFPSADIDLAFVVADAIPAGAVERTLRAAGGELLRSVELFDVYRGESVAEGARSLAFHLRFCSLDRTLTDREVGELRSQCIDAVASAHHAVLR